MSDRLTEAPVVVVAEDNAVRCVECGSLWAGPFDHHDTAGKVARAMNHDPYYKPLRQVRAEVCCTETLDPDAEPVIEHGAPWSLAVQAGLVGIVAGRFCLVVGGRLIGAVSWMARHGELVIVAGLAGALAYQLTPLGPVVTSVRWWATWALLVGATALLTAAGVNWSRRYGHRRRVVERLNARARALAKTR